MIHENYSDQNIELDKIANQSNIIYKLHDINYGFDYNVLSLYESCKTEYIWFLGCDDKTLPFSINQIFNKINEFKFTAMIINWNGYDHHGNKKYEKGILYPDFLIENSQINYFKVLGPQFFLSSYILKKEK